MTHHVVISELFADLVHSKHLGPEKRTTYNFVFELDVGQLVFQLNGVRASEHLCSRGEHHFGNGVVVQDLGLENAVVGQDLVFEPDAVLGSEDLFQLVFSLDARRFLVPGFGAYLAQVFALDTLLHHVVLFSTRRNRSSNVL